MNLREMTLQYRPSNICLSDDTMSTPHTAASVLQRLIGDEVSEVFIVMLLNTRHRVESYHVVARGSIDDVHVTPREVLRAALMANAPGLIVSHNHPSGDPDPSPADEAFTKRLAAAATILGLDLLDHIVIGHDRYVSFKEAGLMA
jgi:DNA repair protein RadC